jgi:hypothetical protein
MDAEQFKLIDTAIGLMFIFLIVSIGVTALMQALGSLLRLRSVNLVQGLIWMLGDKPAPDAAQAGGLLSRLAGLIIGHKDMAAPVPAVVGNEAAAAAPDSLTRQVLQHPLINKLAAGDRVTPHIDPKLFASAFVTVLNDAQNNHSPFDNLNDAFADVATLVGTVKNDAVRNALSPLIARAQAAATTAEEKAKAGLDAVEQWYDQSMTQASDWYKSRTQGATLALAAILVVAGNVDSIRIASALWNDNGLRQAYVAQATAAAANPDYLKSACPGMADAQAFHCNIEQTQNAVKELNRLPIGWRSTDYYPAAAAAEQRPPDRAHIAWMLLKHIPGWLLTIAAASLGAPFWFGMLQRVTPLRSKGDSGAK